MTLRHDLCRVMCHDTLPVKNVAFMRVSGLFDIPVVERPGGFLEGIFDF